MRDRRWWLVALLGWLPVGAGCYSYVATGAETLVPGDVVRLRVTPQEVARLDDLFSGEPWYGGTTLFSTGLELMSPFEEDGWIGGRFRFGQGDQLGVALRRPNASDRTVTLRIPEVARLERQQLNRTRTALLLGGVLVGAVGLLQTIHLGGNPGSTPGPPSGGGGPFQISWLRVIW